MDMDMGYLWLKGNQIEHCFTAVTKLLPKISLCILPKRQVVGMSSQREVALLFTACALTSSYTDLNSTVM
jgi:hypothetical protein